MKRSRFVPLIALGSASVTLMGCESKQEALVFENIEQCVESQQLPEVACKLEFEKALAAHQNSAPRFSDKSTCEADFGANGCVSHNSGGQSFFIPLMAGYMLASIVNSGSSYRYGGFGSSYSQPLYRTRSDFGSNYRTADNYQVSSTGGKSSIPTSVSAPQTRAVTMSRSGFGSTASARSGWGG